MDLHVLQLAIAGPPERQRRHVVEALERSLAAGADLVVAPELIAHGVAEPLELALELAEPCDGPFVNALEALTAACPGTVVAGYYQREPDGRVHNVVAVVAGGQVLARYAKVHLYDAFGAAESSVLAAGSSPCVVEVGGWRLGLLTCFDLRFAELSVLLGQLGAEVLVVPAAWMPGPGKVEQLEVLARARALDTASYLVLADQAGPTCCGSSAVIAPDGSVCTSAPVDGEAWLRVELDRRLVEARREVLPLAALRRCEVQLNVGARSGTRTRTSSRTEVFETSASADSAIRAGA